MTFWTGVTFESLDTLDALVHPRDKTNTKAVALVTHFIVGNVLESI
jgi:hypothetical protein